MADMPPGLLQAARERPQERFVECCDCGTWKQVLPGQSHPWCGCGSDQFDWGNELPYHPERGSQAGDGARQQLADASRAAAAAPAPMDPRVAALLASPCLYERTGDIKDVNTLLVNVGALRAALNALGHAEPDAPAPVDAVARRRREGQRP